MLTNKHLISQLKQRANELENDQQLTLLEAIPAAANQQHIKISERLHGAGLQVKSIITQLGMDTDSLHAAELYPWYTCSPQLADLINEHADDDVINILKGANELTRFDGLLDKTDANNPRSAADYGENLRRLLLTMVQDPRVLLLRLAWHLYRLSHADELPAKQAESLAMRTQQLFAPLANRLGIWQIKWQLEDLSLRQLQPEAYHNIAKLLTEKRSIREQYLDDFLRDLKALVHDSLEPQTSQNPDNREAKKYNTTAQFNKIHVAGRAKHIYSIWRKMQLKHKHFDELSDMLATRIIVPDLPSCYTALGAVHNRWRPVPGEFDDYIAKPKPNGYQSLHTAVYDSHGRIVEVQIRSQAMHDFAELGIAAHWNYKESGHSAVTAENELNKKINWLRKIIAIQDDDELEARLQDEVFEERVYVFTPTGDIVDLVHNATPLDFAYHIHTDLGHRCRGAKVNGRIVPLTFQLSNGDRVEILSTNEAKPSRDWLHSERGYLASARARGKVRHWFRQQDRDEHVHAGEDIVRRELRQSKSSIKVEALLQGLSPQTIDELYAATGSGDISSAQIQGAIQRAEQRAEHQSEQQTQSNHGYPQKLSELEIASTRAKSNDRTAASSKNKSGVLIDVDDDNGLELLNFRAKCCNPMPPENIAGFITKNRGIAIHKIKCRNLQRLKQTAQERLIEASWSADVLNKSNRQKTEYTTILNITAWDRPGLLRDISNVLAGRAINVQNMQSHIDNSDMVHSSINISVNHREELDELMLALKHLSGINSITRS